MRNIGDIVELTDEARENYTEFSWSKEKLRIIGISKSIKDHPGYDMGLFPEALYDLETENNRKAVECSLYDWELKYV